MSDALGGNGLPSRGRTRFGWEGLKAERLDNQVARVQVTPWRMFLDGSSAAEDF